MYSFWSETADLPHFPRLEGDIKTQVLVIGGGLTGLLCAYFLEKAGVKCVLLEAKSICGGVSALTTAKLTSQHGLLYQQLLRRFGAQKAEQYLDVNEAALQKYQELCRNIDCDYQETNSYVYSLKDVDALKRELKTLHRFGFSARFAQKLPLPMETAGAVCFPGQAQFHPLKFATAICSKLHIFEQTPVSELVGTTAVTPYGKVAAEKIIVATHFPFLNKHGSYFLKLYQERSYVLALKNAPLPDGMFVDASGKGLSFRRYGELLLLGGGSHRTGKPGGGFPVLERFAAKVYPQAQIVTRWATQDCMTLDGVPYIGSYSARTEGLFVATGFCKWGMSSSMVAATVLYDLVRGRRSVYADLFSPSRSILRPQLAANAGEAVCGLLKPTRRRCPHLGCALHWNSLEHTWDCACHGSRFTEKGQLINNPATGDLKDTQR